MAIEYKIFPPIGFGRLGNAAEFVIAREKLGGRETELNASGTEVEVIDYKVDVTHIKPVGARFRVFAFLDDGTPAQLIDAASSASID